MADEEFYNPYDYHRAGLMVDMRKNTSNELSAARADALQSMIDLILQHKKEIVKIPQATTLKGAQDWAAKRPNAGYRVAYTDIGGDEEKEVVVYDKGGRPFMINGYKMKPSDYGLRKAYWEQNPRSEDRAGNPMREWAAEYAWNTKEDPKNMWNRTVNKNSENYDRMKTWGYRMPTKPKTEISPYAIFSKLIAPLVKNVLSDEEFQERIRDSLGGHDDVGDNNFKFLSKIISPISYYRYLYMKLVEQKYFFSLTQSPQIARLVGSYDQFKAYTKKNKATFRTWFIDNILSGARKEKFSERWVSEDTIKDALVNEEIHWDGSDLQDGLVFLIGVDNVQSEGVITTSDGTKFNFIDFMISDRVAAMFLDVLGNKKDSDHREAKKLMDRWKRVAQKSMDNYFKNDKVKRLFFENEKARQKYLENFEKGVPQATSEATAQRQDHGSPLKQSHLVKQQQEEPPTTGGGKTSTEGGSEPTGKPDTE